MHVSAFQSFRMLDFQRGVTALEDSAFHVQVMAEHYTPSATFCSPRQWTLRAFTFRQHGSQEGHLWTKSDALNFHDAKCRRTGGTRAAALGACGRPHSGRAGAPSALGIQSPPR